MKKRFSAIFLLFFVCSVAFSSAGSEIIRKYDVVVESKSNDPYSSLITGNGDIGANVWVEDGGDLLFYLSKTDSYSENGRLLKLGRVRVSFDPNPFEKGKPFKEVLSLADSQIRIFAGDPGEQIKIIFWIDSNKPIVHVETQSENKYDVEVTMETWRNEKRLLKNLTVGDLYRLSEHKTWVYPDTVKMDSSSGKLYWYHYNENSAWPLTMKHQMLEEMMEKQTDPLLHRIFGGVIWGEGLKAKSERVLVTDEALTSCNFQIAVLTEHPSDPEEWQKSLDRIVDNETAGNVDKRRAEHRKWWHDFWDRSYIDISGNEDGKKVALGYNCQRYVSACGGRGKLPIKFNGSIFTVDDPAAGNDPDWRNWGPGHWFQNLRLPYWAMLMAGDFDMMDRLFNMYLNNLELYKYRTRLFYDHGGVFLNEMTYFFGPSFNELYQWKEDKAPTSLAWKDYIESGLELSKMMLEYYRHTQDRDFVKKYINAITIPVIEFYDLHYPRTKDGQLKIAPSLALETYKECVNPMPAVAGLHSVLRGLLDLPKSLTHEEERKRWKRLYEILPPLPTREIEGAKMFAPADKFKPTGHWEMPEMHCVFPYRLKGLGNTDLDMVCKAFENRLHKGGWGWEQDDIMMAYLGLVEKVKANIVKRASNVQARSVFPAFWVHNLNWAPCQDHGSVLMIALQRMLVQSNGNSIIVMPCWPKEWDVRFKLWTVANTYVEGDFKAGRFESLNVTPDERSNDLVIWNNKCE